MGDLDRFIVAQQGVYDDALTEIRRGRKVGHWIWFVFPQLAGLGRSPTSRSFAIDSLGEARAYLEHPVLGVRLRECADALLAVEGRTAEDIFGLLDALKVRSSMTLFHLAEPGEASFAAVLSRYYDGVPDAATEALLAGEAPGWRSRSPTPTS